jgi:hypothetical protein
LLVSDALERLGAYESHAMTLHDIKGRAGRLVEPTRGLAKETVVVEDAEDPLLYHERQDYLQALREALAGAGGALCSTVQRSLAGRP